MSNWDKFKGTDLSMYQCDNKVSDLAESILTTHWKRVDSLLDERLQVILAMGLTRRERRLDTSKLHRNCYPDKTEWFYKDELILTSTLPKVGWVQDELMITEGVIL